ncbi:MAG: D-sedoheptulose 7-phosphate isomerase [Cyclobacteriaceae bacterium]|jgi:D-sedoheptulose 7-phosphate isomerase
MLYYKNYTAQVIETLGKIDHSQLEAVKNALVLARSAGKTIYIFGNGGSGGTASHITGDFIKGASYKQENRFRIICLNDNFSAIGAISNDISYDHIFSEQLKNFAQEGDLVIGLSGSGNSENVVRGLDEAKKLKATTIAICGYSGGRIKEMADLVIHIPVNDMEITEDLHLMVFHMMKQAIIKEQNGSLDDMGEKYVSRLK